MQACSPPCFPSLDEFVGFLEAAISTSSAIRRTMTFLFRWCLVSYFSPQGPLDHPDRVLSRFLWKSVHERYAFDFCVDHIAPFRGFGGVFEASLNPFPAAGFYGQWSLSDFLSQLSVNRFRLVRTQSISNLREDHRRIFIGILEDISKVIF